MSSIKGNCASSTASKKKTANKRKRTSSADNDEALDDCYLYPNGSRRMSIYGPKYVYGPKRIRYEDTTDESDEPCSSSNATSDKAMVSSPHEAKVNDASTKPEQTIVSDPSTSVNKELEVCCQTAVAAIKWNKPEDQLSKN